MKYSRIKGLDKDISKLVFGTATPKLFAAVAPDATNQDEDVAFTLLLTMVRKLWEDGWRKEVIEKNALS